MISILRYSRYDVFCPSGRWCILYGDHIRYFWSLLFDLLIADLQILLGSSLLCVHAYVRVLGLFAQFYWHLELD